MHINQTFQPHRRKPYNHDFLFPKLIADIWDLQIDFWKKYQDIRHTATDPDTTNTSSHQELQAQVRHMFSLAEDVLQSQRQHLFPSDIDSFLDISSPAQLSNYIDTDEHPTSQTSSAPEYKTATTLRLHLQYPTLDSAGSTRPRHRSRYSITNRSYQPHHTQPSPSP